ncbi:hypothetical protein [Paenibacillus sp. J2TS4]|uniref:hypothetical protein n=1 Tax=Paenibacillus sp. J2TS4 TaxID=2807194 RepID=UPI001B2B8975|nr:hypothetical protein [Paenibacillus sp. J2TS4]GIP32702.1 hypothetical protein J2TS4_19120 [Paenibacillus sp. J2TS4]
MRRRKLSSRRNRYVTVPLLRRVTASMIPFYCKIVTDRCFAKRWSAAVRKADLDRLDIMFHKATPVTRKTASLSTNGIGYMVGFNVKAPIYEYVNSTSIRPGHVQFTFSTPVHRAIAKAVLPLYREIAKNRCFAAKIVQAIHRNDNKLLNVLVRSLIPSKALHSVQVDESGIMMAFKFRKVPYLYYNELYRFEFD